MSGPIDLIKKSFEIFFKKENLTYFLKIYILLVPFAVFNLFENSYISFKIDSNFLSNFNSMISKYTWFLPVFVIVNLAYLVISFWVSAAGIKACANVVNSTNLDVKSTLGFAWKKLFLFSILSLVLTLIIGFGFILLIIPGIIFLVWFRFSGFEFMTKDVGIGASLSGSKKLAKGKFWKVFGRLLVFGLFGVLFQAILGAFPMNIGSIILPLLGGLFILPYFLLYEELTTS